MTRSIVAPAIVAAALGASPAAAQPTPPAPGQGPMIVERIHGGWLAAPDVKVTDVDKKTSALAGGYGGYMTDSQLFVGGGGYWLANRASDRKMAYGGIVVGWQDATDRRFGFGVRGLLGGGQATLSSSVTELARFPDFGSIPLGMLGRDIDRVVGGTLTTRVVRREQGFFVAEPQADVIFKFTNHLRLTGGIGYRLIGAEDRDDSRLRGVSGSVAFQIGGGS